MRRALHKTQLCGDRACALTLEQFLLVGVMTAQHERLMVCILCHYPSVPLFAAFDSSVGHAAPTLL